MQLNKIAPVDTHPEILLRLPGRQQLITKASNGNNTAPNAKNRVNESWYDKVVSNKY
jgi:hypothetical protein